MSSYDQGRLEPNDEQGKPNAAAHSYGDEFHFKFLMVTSGLNGLSALFLRDWTELGVSVVATWLALLGLRLFRRVAELEKSK